MLIDKQLLTREFRHYGRYDNRGTNREAGPAVRAGQAASLPSGEERQAGPARRTGKNGRVMLFDPEQLPMIAELVGRETDKSLEETDRVATGKIAVTTDTAAL